MKVVLVTGGFDPLHSGHIEYFKKSLEMSNDEKIQIHHEKLKELKNLCENTKIKLSKVETANMFIKNSKKCK